MVHLICPWPHLSKRLEERCPLFSVPFSFFFFGMLCVCMCALPGRRRLFLRVVFRGARRRRRSQQGDRLGQVLQLGAPEPDQRHVLCVMGASQQISWIERHSNVMHAFISRV